MKKIGIITIVDPNPNYGNKLQNYAVIKVMSKLGVSPNTIVTKEQPRFLGIIKRYCISFLRKIKNGNSSEFLKQKRNLAFRRFDKRYLKLNNCLLNGNIDIDDYDCFVAGSDQIWNTTWYYGNLHKFYLLSFAKDEQKISFSASFGIEELPEKWKPWFKEELAKFRAISVRENEGAKIVKELTGKDAQVLIDPTLMLDSEEWMQIAKKPKVDCEKPYILTYFLDKKSDLAEEYLEQIVQKTGYRVYSLLDITSPRLMYAGPKGFIYLFSKASIVLTDSFHACVFSFLFQKPFLVFDRETKDPSMNSRLNTFLKKFHLLRKYANLNIDNDIFEHDYIEGVGQLNREREKVIGFLKKAMKLEKADSVDS